MTIDLNFYPEQQTATLAALPKIVVDCDLTGWTRFTAWCGARTKPN